MRVDVLSVQEAVHAFDWSGITDRNPALASPFFRPEFAAIVAESRPAFVAVVDDGRAFLPFHKHALGIGKPVGNGLSDYQGLIAQHLGAYSIPDLLERAGLSMWDFNHVPVTQGAFLGAARSLSASPRVIIERAEIPKALRDNISNRRRKLEREIGPVTFEFRNPARADFDLTMRWKRTQYARTGNYDIMAHQWAQHTIERTRELGGPGYSGVFSTIKAGDRLVAGHFGIRSGPTLHYWIPAYDPELSLYSPGMMLLLELIAKSPGHGVETIDFGKGGQFYKDRLANDIMPVMEGAVSVSRLATAVMRGRAASQRLRGRLRRIRAAAA